MTIDEICVLLGKRVRDQGRHAQRRSPTSSRRPSSRSAYLEEASEGFTFDVIPTKKMATRTFPSRSSPREEDISPIIRLVDTTIFTALQRRASDIHLETHDDSVVIKYRIDGVLQAAMAPIASEHHSTIFRVSRS